MFRDFEWCSFRELICMFNVFDNLKFINRLAFLIGGLAVFILIFSFVEYGVNNWFTVNKVIVTGDMEHVDQNDLKSVAINTVEGNLFTFDIHEMQANFLEIPWVKHIAVSRSFPNDVMVNISEYKAIAYLGDFQLISDDGKVFNGTATESLPVFDTSVDNVSEALSDYHLIGRVLPNRNLSIKRISINGMGITKLYFSNDLQVVICGSEIEAELKLLDSYWDKLYTINPGLNYVNMCYKNAMAINAINKSSAVAVKSVESGKVK